jgi:hypothetical protein
VGGLVCERRQQRVGGSDRRRLAWSNKIHLLPACRLGVLHLNTYLDTYVLSMSFLSSSHSYSLLTRLFRLRSRPSLVPVSSQFCVCFRPARLCNDPHDRSWQPLTLEGCHLSAITHGGAQLTATNRAIVSRRTAFSVGDWQTPNEPQGSAREKRCRLHLQRPPACLPATSPGCIGDIHSTHPYSTISNQLLLDFILKSHLSPQPSFPSLVPHWHFQPSQAIAIYPKNKNKSNGRSSESCSVHSPTVT